MTRRPLTDVAASVRARLYNRSRETGEDFQFLLERYAGERFLYRLGESAYRDRFVLKGAMLFALWADRLYRPTRDLDFSGYGGSDPAEVVAALEEVCRLDVADDGVDYDLESFAAEPIRGNAEYDGVRIRFFATLSRARVRLQVDVGFGDALAGADRLVEYPTLLDAPPPRIRAYRREGVVAEKLHAMVDHGDRNSRLKDFYDLYVLARDFPFDGEALTAAVAATFQRRGAEFQGELPIALRPRFYADDARSDLWRAFLDRSSLQEAGLDFVGVGELLRRFLTPLWRALAAGQALAETWPAAGPWPSQDDEESA